MTKIRADQLLVVRGVAPTRSQAEHMIRMGYIKIDGQAITKAGYFVGEQATVDVKAPTQYVSRAGLKLASVTKKFNLRFTGKIVLDVGSSTGGFTDYALRHGAAKVVAVDVGTDQLHPSLRGHANIELHEQTDIRSVVLAGKSANKSSDISLSSAQAKTLAGRVPNTPVVMLNDIPDIVVIDASFISLRDILPHIATLCGPQTRIAAMLKPQFEAGSDTKHKGVIKNDTVRRQILKDFESWARQYFVLIDKADSEVAGAKGNRERFYLLSPAAK